MVQIVQSTHETVRSGYLDPTAPPVATVTSGESVSFPDTWVHWGNEATFGMTFADREPLRHEYPHGPYSMLGPVVVNGAEPGDVITCTIERLRTIDWGWNSFPLGVGALPDDFDTPYVHYFRFDDSRTRVPFTDDVTLTLDPFVGVIGTEPAGDRPVSAILAGAYGGNLVMNLLREGARVHLPVFRAGGRIWWGDIHGTQGDGVVDQTGIETAAEELLINFTLARHVPLHGPLIETETEWVLFGFDANLDDALTSCLRGTIQWLHDAAGMDKSDAYALSSLAVSFRVAQYAHQTNTAYDSIPPKAVSAVIPKSLFGSTARDRVTNWLKGAGDDA